jgi:hypothetical protein
MPKMKVPKGSNPASELMGIANPMGVMGMVGGLPDGLNAQAIEEVLKRMNIPIPEKPATDILKGIPEGIRKSLPSDLRWEELMKKFGFGGK